MPDAPSEGRSDRLRNLREQLVPVLKPYVNRITLFGSVARGEEHPDSDLDVLVTLKPSSERPTLELKWFELEQMLSERLGKPVELVTEDALSPHVRPHISSDRVVLYVRPFIFAISWTPSNKSSRTQPGSRGVSSSSSE